MKKKRLYKGFALLAAMALGVSLLSGCAGRSTESLQKREDAETIQVYLWTATLYEKYAPYVQAQLPDVNIEFIVGNNDLDFYKFLQQNGGLPDIITCCRTMPMRPGKCPWSPVSGVRFWVCGRKMGR